MGRIEELPDDFDESLDLNKEPIFTPPAAKEPSFLPSGETPFGIKQDALPREKSTTPAMPPAMESVKSHTADEIIALMNQTPLFMTDVDKALQAEGENVQLDAIRALQNEGTRADNAQRFRENGNEFAKTKQWKDAKECYTKGISTLTMDNNWEEPEDPKVEAQRLREVEEAEQIEADIGVENYRSTTLDCAATLKLNPKNVKAFYRSAAALLALDKVVEADDACMRGLHLDKSNQPLQTLSKKIATRRAELDKIAARKRAEEEHAQKVRLTLSTALRAREITVRETAQPPDMEDAVMKLSPDPLSAESTIVFPCVLLYPMHAQSDFIKEFAETDTIAHHLKYILPLPWDTKGEYTIGSVDCYIETANGGMIKPGKKVSLLAILSGGKVEIVDGLVRINVVPTKMAGKWIAEMKARKNA
ncbi:TPR repeat protein [Arthroderma uncinatum]|uniref:TPR repeat protein n=1 Tax=Arthroderma uncinatum TaxID=74035 RepID=UPI00144AD96D|nr:TPR repeat protein [Arthroderma uncinatum]KAF3482587.1 TPR repeat protein [Arthroderma uncinatum]